MGRPIKVGLKFFSFDVDFFEDDKIELISSEFGLKGEIITIKLLCKIYKNGYYYKWGDDECLLFAKRAGVEIVPSAVNEVIMGLVRRRFFDKGCFDSFQILTSAGIQKRYIKATNERLNIELIEDYWLIDKPENNQYRFINLINPPKNPLINSINPPINSDDAITTINSVDKINPPINHINLPINSPTNLINPPINSDDIINPPINLINPPINPSILYDIKREDIIRKKENKPEKISGEDFLDLIMNDFSCQYFDNRKTKFVITNKDKERSSIGRLQKILLERAKKLEVYQNCENKTEFMIDRFKKLFEYCFEWKENNFLQDGISPSLILNQINKIFNKIDGKTNGRAATTDKDKERIITGIYGNH